jgi:hypothetical protein
MRSYLGFLRRRVDVMLEHPFDRDFNSSRVGMVE